MENELTIRDLTEEDYDTICEWWKWWWKTTIIKDFLPGDGKGGYMVEKNQQPIACGFLYKTNSKTAFLGCVVSNPKYKQKDRRYIIEHLIKNIEKISKKMGYNYMFTVCRNTHLIEIHEKLGWLNSGKSSYEIIKKL